MQTMVWQCEFCRATYKRQNNYNKHILTCRMLCDSATPEDKIIPSREELYTIVLGLVRDQAELREEIKSLKSISHIRKKISYIDWLKDHHTPCYSLKSWIDNLILTEAHFQIVISDTNFMRAMTTILQSTRANKEIVPFVGFDKQPTKLYVYQEDKWSVCLDSDIMPLINHLFKSLRSLLNDWESVSQKNLNRDDFEDKYARYVIRIMGPSVETPELCRLFRRILYDVVKLNLRNVIEYEFTA